jgi:hypothetical protein
VVDIRKTFEGFEADLRMIARRTEKWNSDYVDKVFHDVIKLAEAKYLRSVSIILEDMQRNQFVLQSTPLMNQVLPFQVPEPEVMIGII